MPLPGMSLPGLLCVPGMKESKSQYKLEGRDVVYLCVRPGADFGTTAFAAKCLAEVRAVLPSSEPVDAIAFSMGCSMLAQLAAQGLELANATLISPAGHYHGTWTEALLRRATAFGARRYATGFWVGLSTYPTYVAGGANAWEYETLHTLAQRVHVYSAASDFVHCNDVLRLAADRRITFTEADGGHFGPKSYVPALARRKAKAPTNAEAEVEAEAEAVAAPKPRQRRLFSHLLQPYWTAHWMWVVGVALVCQALWGKFLARPLASVAYAYTYCALWAAIEYVYHRFLQHHVLRPTHWTHHRRPHDEKHLRSPAGMIQLYGCALCLGVQALHAAVGVYEYPPFYPWLALCYLAFEFAHATAHKASPPAWLEACRCFHVQHHKTPWLNYGFVSPLCDHLFGSCHADYAASWASIVAFGPIPFLSFYLLPKVASHDDYSSDDIAEEDNTDSRAARRSKTSLPVESPIAIHHYFTK